MTLAAADGPPAGRLPRRPRALSAGAVPPPALILLGILSVQIGAGIAKHLFDRLPPSAVVFLRLLTSAVVLAFLARRALRTVLADHSPRSLAVAAGFGVSLCVMNTAIYQAMARIPLGAAVTIEFLGPLAVAVAASRRVRDVGWALLAGAGVVLLARGGDHLDLVGVGLALLAGVGWACYILLSAATGRRFAGSTGLAAASVVAAAVAVPFGVAAGGTALLDWRLLLLGLGVGVLSSVIPYSLEMEALRRVPPRVFGVLMSLEPAVAALVGVLLLGEVLGGRQWAAIGCVIVASAGATLGTRGTG
ncbi:Threonine/homoserine exporter RhtA [Actinomadura rubteroloni]|uniref:Threonine/homoserine exporter RhtA n=1 Tax=Actinomadura rubteroloni TaxID=1926885 RepID=A0A2P4UBC2_9ACTN|nr:EamA family transporter [Actinomadura rubteroloni]POM22314.1 Threonine/homoserine exporter RhtA [Actinomadura rubteroloni]